MEPFLGWGGSVSEKRDTRVVRKRGRNNSVREILGLRDQTLWQTRPGPFIIGTDLGLFATRLSWVVGFKKKDGVLELILFDSTCKKKLVLLLPFFLSCLLVFKKAPGYDDVDMKRYIFFF